MVDLDKPFFTSELAHFGTVNRITVSRDLKIAYWEDLRAMSLSDFKHACKHLRHATKWFPKPSEFWAARRVGWM